jgi:hypothetical protein
MVQKRTYGGTKAFLKGKESGLFVNFGKSPCSWIRIRVPNTAKSMQIRIHKAALDNA